MAIARKGRPTHGPKRYVGPLVRLKHKGEVLFGMAYTSFPGGFMSKDPTAKKSKSKAPAPVKLASRHDRARVSHGDALERLKNAYLAGQTASAELEHEVELDYREQFQHHIVPTPLEIVLELASLTDEERLRLQSLKDGTAIPAQEGGAGHPVGPQGEAEAQAMQTRRPGGRRSEFRAAGRDRAEPPARGAQAEDRGEEGAHPEGGEGRARQGREAAQENRGEEGEKEVRSGQHARDPQRPAPSEGALTPSPPTSHSVGGPFFLCYHEARCRSLRRWSRP